MPRSHDTYADVLCTNNQQPDVKPEKFILSAHSKEKVNIGLLDNLLGSRTGGPVALNVNKNNDRVFITFRDPTSRDKARLIIGSTGQQLLSNVSQQNARFPVIVKFVDVSVEPSCLLEDIKLRNPSIREHALSLNIIYRA